LQNAEIWRNNRQYQVVEDLIVSLVCRKAHWNMFPQVFQQSFCHIHCFISLFKPAEFRFYFRRVKCRINNPMISATAKIAHHNILIFQNVNCIYKSYLGLN
jgi:hypothetical protein